MFSMRRNPKPIVVESVVLAVSSSDVTPQIHEFAVDVARRRAIPSDAVRLVATQTDGVVDVGESGVVDLVASGMKAFRFEAVVSDGDR